MKRILLALLLLLPTHLFGQLPFSQQTVSFTTATSGSSINQIGSGVNYNRLSWYLTGTISTCQIKVEKSSNNSSWSDLISAQTCTTEGVSSVTSGTAGYIRITVTTLSGGGTVTATYMGFVGQPNASSSSSDAQYILQVANASLTNAQSMGALATGLVKNTTTSGVQSIAVSGTDYEPGLTFNAPITRSVNAITLPVATSSQNGYLSSTDWSTFNNKESALTFSTGLNRSVNTITNIGVLSLTAGGGVTVSGSTGAITLGLITPITLASGGTNAALTASNGAIPYSTTTAFDLLAPGSSGQLFRSGGAGAPTWTTATFPVTAGTSGNVLTSDGTNWVSSTPTGTFTGTVTAGQIVVANQNNVLGSVATVAVASGGTALTSYAIGDILYASGATTLARLADVATGSLLVSGGVGVAPAYSTYATQSITRYSDARWEHVQSSRDLTAASGTQDITGFGFDPVICFVFAIKGETAAASIAYYEGSENWGNESPNGSAGTIGTYTSTATIVDYVTPLTGNSVRQSATGTFITDGIRLTWTKAGSPTGTLDFGVLCGR